MPENATLLGSSADNWRCHATNHTAGLGNLNERNCALVAMGHVLSISAPLWAVALALKCITRTMCGASHTTKKSCWRRFCAQCFHWLACLGLPMALCALLAADRSCDDTNQSHMAKWMARACNATHAPHFGSWADLAWSLASGEDGDKQVLFVIGLPSVLAFCTSALALVLGPATCAMERFHAQHLHTPRRLANRDRWKARTRGGEPMCASLAFFALSILVTRANQVYPIPIYPAGSRDRGDLLLTLRHNLKPGVAIASRKQATIPALTTRC